jgi:predicted HD superfamily hydrolase involved in NAD metabolism
MAGLLHDICACESYGEQLKYIRSRDILLDKITLAQPDLWHARCGELQLCDLGVRDFGLLRAVRYHTTGRSAMSSLEMVVYLADKTCEGRDYHGLGELRALADADLKEAMRMSLIYTVHTLTERRIPIVRDALEAYNYYIAKGV